MNDRVESDDIVGILDDAIEVAQIPLERKDPSVLIPRRSEFLRLVRHVSKFKEGYVLLRHGESLFLLWNNRVFILESR
jgi:hypothetical protein